MEFEFDYQLTRKAETDLDDIVAYIAVELANPRAASDFLDKLQGIIRGICTFPESGVPVNNEFLPADHKIRKKYVGNYIVFYVPDYSRKCVQILRILYNRRNIDEILREMD